MELIRFDTNVPQEMAFSFPTGKEVEGRYGPQFYRGTTDGRACYLPPIVEERLRDAEVAPGERVAICKREQKDGRKKGIVWEVKRVDAPGQPAETVGGNPAKNSPTATAAQPKQVNGHSQAITAPAPAQTNVKPVIHTQSSALMASAMIAAIDALETATQYGHEKGLQFQFEEEDVRAVANSIYIQHFKNAELTLRYGGNTSWQQ